MIALLTKIGLITEAVKGVESTETGQFALKTAKLAIVSSVVISAVIGILIIRSINKTFGATRKDVEVMKSQLQNARKDIDEQKILQNGL